LVVVLAAIAVFLCAGFPIGARQRSLSSQTERLMCQGNLGQIGRAYQLWASEHGDQNPFMVEPTDGGIKGVAAANNLWFQFAWISNELRTPKLLVCPSDSHTTRIARDFSSRPDGGFLNPNYRNNAVSYFLGLHTFRDNPGAILAGDPNVTVSLPGGLCSYSGLSAVSTMSAFNPPSFWTNAVHGLEGNVLLNDASVRFFSVQDLQRHLASASTDAQRVHVLSAK
jgi:hypothetical protein